MRRDASARVIQDLKSLAPKSWDMQEVLRLGALGFGYEQEALSSEI